MVGGLRDAGYIESGRFDTRRFTVFVPSLIIGVFACFAVLKLLSVGKVSHAFVLLTYSTLVCVISIATFKAFLEKQGASFFGVKGPRGLIYLLLSSVLSGVALEALTLFGAPLGSPLVPADWGIKRVLIFALLSFMALAWLSRGHKLFQVNPDSLISKFKGEINKRSVVLAVCALLAAAMVCCWLALTFKLSFTSVALFGIAVVFPLTVIACSLRASQIPEWIFMSIALPIGLVLCVAIPPMTGVSWDDQIHYKNALNLSYVTSPEITNEEQKMSEMAIRLALGEDEGINREMWPVDVRRDFESRINDSQLVDIKDARIFKQYYPDQLLSFASLGYIPAAIGLWIGRLLHISFAATVVLGRVANLFAYCLACFWAIRISPVKKVLFVVASLIPENIFLAANYSYDPWLTSMVLLGTAILFREMWGDDNPIAFSGVISAALVMFLGLGVKAVYFPIIGIFFLMPVNKFVNKRQRAQYYLLVILFGLFVLASFALPFLFDVGTGAAPGDQRGGSGVNSSGQLSFILNNPIQYAGILESFFVTTFFNPGNSSGYLFSFAYLAGDSPVDLSIASLNNPAVNLVPVLFLIGVAIFDNEDGEAWRHANKGSTIWTSIIYLGTYILVATALYVSFTPVGHGTVNGCQLRYQLPILAPMLALLLNYGKPLGFKDGTKKAIYLSSLLCLSFWTFVFVVSRCVA